MNSSLIFWKSAVFTVYFVYVGFSKHSIVKTFLLIRTLSALFILCFHRSGCVGESIVGRAAILPVRFSSTALCRSATGTEPDFPLNPFPCWSRATRWNTAPTLCLQLSWQPAPHTWTWSWSLYWGRKDWNKEAGEAATRRTGTDWTRDWKKGKPMPKPIRCARETEQGDLMRDLKFSSTEDNSEASLAPFSAVKGNQLLILLL